MSKFDIRKAKDRERLRTERAMELSAIDGDMWPRSVQDLAYWGAHLSFGGYRNEMARHARALCVAEMQYLNAVEQRILSGELWESWEGRDPKTGRTFTVRADEHSENIECVFDTTDGEEVFVGRTWHSDFYVVEGQMRHGSGYLAECPGQTPGDELDYFTEAASHGARGTAILRLLNAARHRGGLQTAPSE